MGHIDIRRCSRSECIFRNHTTNEECEAERNLKTEGDTLNEEFTGKIVKQAKVPQPDKPMVANRAPNRKRFRKLTEYEDENIHKRARFDCTSQAEIEEATGASQLEFRSIHEEVAAVERKRLSIALLIDGENIAARYAEEILEITNILGECELRKVFGNV